MVYFIGAGPGDHELITVKGKRLIENADIIIYAGSLINPEILNYARKNPKTYDSAKMTLEEVIDIIKKYDEDDKVIARVHSGDPSIYGAIREQIDILEELKIKYEVVPGVSSFTASASRLNREFTLPGITQTIICTRLEGRTPVPEKENLESLAMHKASMAIFLSIHMIDDVVKKLLTHYDKDTPVAVIQKATWKDEKIIQGKLDDISDKVKKEKINKTAIILVGYFLGNTYDKSKLYDKNFTHGFRESK